MARADLRDSDSFFENEIESDTEQTLIRRTRLCQLRGSHADVGFLQRIGRRLKLATPINPANAEILMMASIHCGPSRREQRLRSGIAALSGRDGSSHRIYSGLRLIGICGVGHNHRIGLGLLKSSARRDAPRPLPALAGIPHQGSARGPIEHASCQSFGPGGLLLKILRGHRCTSSAQVQANACVRTICLSCSGLCERGHLHQAFISRTDNRHLNPVSSRADEPPCCMP